VSGNGQIIWEDPPPGPDRTRRWERILAPLVEHPNRWARVTTTPGRTANVFASNLRRGRYHIPPGRWEFVSRKLDDGHTAVYARYLGPDEP
jgi:hypothetical protein